MRIPTFKSIVEDKILRKTSKIFFWFSIGVIFGSCLLFGFVLIIIQKVNYGAVYPSIMVEGEDLGGKKEKEINKIFEEKNAKFGESKFVFFNDAKIATISADKLEFGYDPKLIGKQALSIGRGDNFFSNISLITEAYVSGIRLEPAYHYLEEPLLETLTPFANDINKDPVDALFSFQNGKVTAFRPSSEGQMVDIDKIKDILTSKFKELTSAQNPKIIEIPIPIKIIKPKVTTDSANDLGIKELIGIGTSLFAHSIQSRIFNITLASERINGALIGPNEIFSFNKALGDVSSFTGYKQAYVIQNGKTVLGDGGGVCQVSTTFFRAILNAGLPIIERNAHAYRVGYYEQDGPPGMDATIYVPTVDLKFKNDTKNYILVQTLVDPDLSQLSIFLYGTSDGRKVEISNPTITNRLPPPEDLYQDDPTLQKGVIKQIDFKAEGARVFFTRKVTKDGKEIFFDKFVSNYAPWRSVFLRGGKE